MRTALIDSEAAALAARQHGLLTVVQLVALGLSEASVRRRVRNGRLTKVDQGVVRIAGSPVTWESQLLAAVLAAGDGAVASHRSAAFLWDLEGSRRGKPEITVPRGRRYDRLGVRTHRSSDLDRVRATRRDWIPVTPIDRTLLDLGAVQPIERVHIALDDARRRQLTDWDRLLDCLVLHARRGRDGVGTLRALVEANADEVAQTESGFERLVHVLLAQAGLPPPVIQHEVPSSGRTIRLDLAYPLERVAIELDGGVHLRRDVWERDHVRQNTLVLAGWTVLRFTWRDYRDHPGRLVSEVRAALAK